MPQQKKKPKRQVIPISKPYYVTQIQKLTQKRNNSSNTETVNQILSEYFGAHKIN